MDNAVTGPKKFPKKFKLPKIELKQFEPKYIEPTKTIVKEKKKGQVL